MGNRFVPQSSVKSERFRSTDTINGRRSLLPWLYRVIGVPNVQLQVRLRGNNLYLLCEGRSCPDRSQIFDSIVQACAATPIEDFLPAYQPSVYQIVLYGRSVGEKRPRWAEVIYLAQIDRYLERQTSKTQIEPNAAIALTDLYLAKQGKPDAIARYLSEELSSLGVAVRASVRSVALSQDVGFPQTANLASVFSSQHDLTPQSLLNRLWIVCESAYSPDMSLMTESIAAKLRYLDLDGFRDAIVFSRVRGETSPEWLLRVDLTPPHEMLKEWARWGDVEALTQLLNDTLSDQSVDTSVTLLDTTLHLTCQRAQPPEKERVLAAIAPLLDTIAPQGIHAATVYGVSEPSPSIPDAPAWVQWVNLPASEFPALADSTRSLAERGDLPAIAFLLTRLLNPDLGAQLATGGIRIQVRQKEDLLHIMTDAPLCPEQNQVGAKVARFVQALDAPAVQGVRVYGRRSGQKRPLWSYGVDFVSRSRLIPEATPEFAASDAYVGDLLTTEPGSLSVRADLGGEEDDNIWNRAIETIQQGFARSRIFTIQSPSNPMAYSAKSESTQGARAALIWGTLGLLLTVQTDWVLGQVIRLQSKVPTESPSETLPPLTLPKSDQTVEPESVFNASSFTQPGQTATSSRSATSDPAPKALQASPLKPKAAIDSSRSPYPTFNANQLDEKFVLYRQYVAQFGAPDVLLVGSSRAMRGIDPVALETALATQGYPGMKIFNFGVNGATAQVVDLIVRRILPSEKMPKLIIFADGLRAFNSGRPDVTYNAIASSPGAKKLPDSAPASVASNPTDALTKPLETISRTNSIVTDSYQTLNSQLLQKAGKLSTLYDQREQLQELLRSNFASRFNLTPTTEADPESTIAQGGQGLIDINGFLPISNRFNPATYYQKYARVPGNSDADYDNFNLNGSQTDALKALARFTRSQNIPLVVINLPLTENYLDSFRREREAEFQQYLTRLSTEQGFVYRDLLENWKTTPDFFSDPSHLNRYGAYAVSHHIAKDPLIPWKK